MQCVVQVTRLILSLYRWTHSRRWLATSCICYRHGRLKTLQTCPRVEFQHGLLPCDSGYPTALCEGLQIVCSVPHPGIKPGSVNYLPWYIQRAFVPPEAKNFNSKIPLVYTCTHRQTFAETPKHIFSLKLAVRYLARTYYVSGRLQSRLRGLRPL